MTHALGPIGSQDPVLPMSINQLDIELTVGMGYLADKWKKAAGRKWFRKFDN